MLFGYGNKDKPTTWKIEAKDQLLAGINNGPVTQLLINGYTRNDAKTKSLVDLSRSSKALKVDDQQVVVGKELTVEELEGLRKKGRVVNIKADTTDLEIMMLEKTLIRNYGNGLGEFLTNNLHQDGCKAIGQTFLAQQFSELNVQAKCSSADVSLQTTKEGVLITEEFDVNSIKTNIRDPDKAMTHLNKSQEPLAHVKLVSALTKDPSTQKPMLEVVGFAVTGTSSKEVEAIFKTACTNAESYKKEPTREGPGR